MGHHPQIHEVFPVRNEYDVDHWGRWHAVKKGSQMWNTQQL